MEPNSDVWWFFMTLWEMLLLELSRVVLRGWFNLRLQGWLLSMLMAENTNSVGAGTRPRNTPTRGRNSTSSENHEARKGGMRHDQATNNTKAVKPIVDDNIKITIYALPQVGEWFRGRSEELRNASGDKKEPGAADDKLPLPPTPENKPSTDDETIPSPAVLAEAAEAEGVPVESGDAAPEAAAVAEEGKKEEAGKGAVVAKEGESVAKGERAGDEEGLAKGLRMSEEELTKLKEEQEERCKELAMNVNVFMPYKVPQAPL